MSGTPSTWESVRETRTERLGTDAAAIGHAAALLREGGLVAFPTETVYGLGADAGRADAVARLYAAKGRPSFNPLITHVAAVATARRIARFDAAADRLAAAFWPGPLTLVLPCTDRSAVCDLARAGLDSVAIRVPSHPVAQALIAAAGRAIVAPSANRSGRISPTAADHVMEDLDGRVDAVVDGGPTAIGVESTIVSCLDEDTRLLRPGGVSRDAIEAALGQPLRTGDGAGSAPVAPGALLSHYAPRATVRLDATEIRPGEAALLFGGTLPGTEGAVARLDLSSSGDLAEAAANLFGHLRRLDEVGAPTIAVAPIPDRGLGEAINDRLRRAAAERG